MNPAANVSRWKRFLDRIGSLSTSRAMGLIFVIHVFFGSITPSVTDRDPIGFDGYIEVAANLARGNGYVFDPGGHKVLHRPPLYIFSLVPGTYLLPESLWRYYAIALNALLLAGAIGIIFSVARPIFGPRITGIAWLIICTNPLLLVRARYAHSGMMQLFAYSGILAMSWLLWRDWRNRRPITVKRGALFGLALLAGALVHGTMIAHAFLLFGVFGIASLYRRDWACLRAVAAGVVVFVLLLAPWTYRNYKVSGMFIPVVGNVGLAYFEGNARWGITEPGIQTGETYYDVQVRHVGLPGPGDSRIRFAGFRTVEDEIFGNAQMKRHLRNHPWDFAEKVLLNAIDYYFPIIYFFHPPHRGFLAEIPFTKRLAMRGAFVSWGISLYNLLLVTPAFAGAIFLLRQPSTRKLAALALLAWAAYVVPYLPFTTSGNTQYYVYGPTPIVSLLAAICLVRPDREKIAAAVHTASPNCQLG
jgi:4-amino-4-deoxy-L-arabinose transferase-like glycosyltransferase